MKNTLSAIPENASNHLAKQTLILVKRKDRDWLLAFVPVNKKEWIKLIKNIHGSKWSKDNGCWILPYVKTSFYCMRDYIKLSNVIFDFKIDPNIPDEFNRNKNSQHLYKAYQPTRFDQLNEAQQEAVIKLEEHLMIRRYSYNTVSAYRNALIGVFYFYKTISPEALRAEYVQTYILDRIKNYKISTSVQNNIINSYKAFSELVLKRPKEYLEIPRPRKYKKLPGVLSKNEVVRLFKATPNLKHKLALLLIYSSGLRVSELINLLKSDVSIDRQAIHIRRTKSRQDRYVPLAKSVIPYLKKYYQEFRPVRWLMEGQYSGQYSARSLQNVFSRALQNSRVDAYATLHTLRHSYATHCLENGYNLKSVQAVLGHRSLKTTEVYLHIAKDENINMQSPLDEIVAKWK